MSAVPADGDIHRYADRSHSCHKQTFQQLCTTRSSSPAIRPLQWLARAAPASLHPNRPVGIAGRKCHYQCHRVSGPAASSALVCPGRTAPIVRPGLFPAAHRGASGPPTCSLIYPLPRIGVDEDFADVDAILRQRKKERLLRHKLSAGCREWHWSSNGARVATTRS
jgi:hypothetical protein